MLRPVEEIYAEYAKNLSHGPMAAGRNCVLYSYSRIQLADTLSNTRRKLCGRVPFDLSNAGDISVGRDNNFTHCHI